MKPSNADKYVLPSTHSDEVVFSKPYRTKAPSLMSEKVFPYRRLSMSVKLLFVVDLKLPRIKAIITRITAYFIASLNTFLDDGIFLYR